MANSSYWAEKTTLQHSSPTHLPALSVKKQDIKKMIEINFQQGTYTGPAGSSS